MATNSNGQGVGTLAAKNVEADHILPRQLELSWQDKADEIRSRWAGLGARFRAEYLAWWNMLRRCTDPKCSSFPNYGGRGITVCDRWTRSFADFLADVGPRPGPGLSLDRYPNNDGHYEPGNVRWATTKAAGGKKQRVRGATEKHSSLEAAKARVDQLAAQAIRRDWTRKERSSGFEAKPDAFTAANLPAAGKPLKK